MNKFLIRFLSLILIPSLALSQAQGMAGAALVPAVSVEKQDAALFAREALSGRMANFWHGRNQTAMTEVGLFERTSYFAAAVVMLSGVVVRAQPFVMNGEDYQNAMGYYRDDLIVGLITMTFGYGVLFGVGRIARRLKRETGRSYARLLLERARLFGSLRQTARTDESTVSLSNILNERHEVVFYQTLGFVAGTWGLIEGLKGLTFMFNVSVIQAFIILASTSAGLIFSIYLFAPPVKNSPVKNRWLRAALAAAVLFTLLQGWLGLFNARYMFDELFRHPPIRYFPSNSSPLLASIQAALAVLVGIVMQPGGASLGAASPGNSNDPVLPDAIQELENAGVPVETLSGTYRVIPEKIPPHYWTMDHIRDPEDVRVYRLAEIPRLKLKYPLNELPLVWEGRTSKVYIGFVEGISHPVIIKSWSPIILEFPDLVETELNIAQLLGREGVSPRFYGVADLPANGLSYVMQVATVRDSFMMSEGERAEIEARARRNGILPPLLFFTPGDRMIALNADNAKITRPELYRAALEAGYRSPESAGTDSGGGAHQPPKPPTPYRSRRGLYTAA